MKKIVLSFFIFVNIFTSYSQELPKHIKNKMINFLFEENQYNEGDLKDLLYDISKNKNVVFWYKEAHLNCENDLKVFYFGTSTEHTKSYALLLKLNGENLILGKDIIEDNLSNKIFNFIQFYNTKDILCFYKNIYPAIVENIYELNSKIPTNNIIFFK